LVREGREVFYELRQYRIRKGKMKEWVALMDREIIPFQISRGMVIAGSFVDEENPNHYVWLRRFKSEAERKKLYERVYDTEQWKTVIAPKVDKLLDRSSIVVTRIVPTPKSVLQ
jgi:hypothetical protein